MRHFFWILVLLPCLLLARPHRSPSHPTPGRPYAPWLTGPLLSPTAVNMVPGEPGIEPSLAFIATYGEYKDDWGLKTFDDPIWAINPLVDYQFAITERTGVEIIASYIYNTQNGQSAAHFEDTIVFFGYQVSDDIPHTPIPDFRLFLQTIWPTGKHSLLDPAKNGIDATGQGSYFLGPELAFQKLIWLDENYLALHWAIGCAVPITKAKLKECNMYGGGRGTEGDLRPGVLFDAFISFEYTFNQNWVFACDTVYIFQTNTTPFSGISGIDPEGLPATNGRERNFQIVLTPSMEYNFTAKSGLLFGSWFTVAGKNTFAFASLYAAFLYYF